HVSRLVAISCRQLKGAWTTEGRSSCRDGVCRASNHDLERFKFTLSSFQADGVDAARDRWIVAAYFGHGINDGGRPGDDGSRREGEADPNEPGHEAAWNFCCCLRAVGSSSRECFHVPSLGTRGADSEMGYNRVEFAGAAALSRFGQSG